MYCVTPRFVYLDLTNYVGYENIITKPSTMYCQKVSSKYVLLPVRAAEGVYDLSKNASLNTLICTLTSETEYAHCSSRCSFTKQVHRYIQQC